MINAKKILLSGAELIKNVMKNVLKGNMMTIMIMDFAIYVICHAKNVLLKKISVLHALMVSY